MKVVRIFLGGSIVLLQGDGERKGYRPTVVDPLISSLNSRKTAKELYVVKTFADLEHEAKPGGQQRLFNHYLTQETDIAIFILENEIGSHSSEELELALENRHKWGHPLVYIYGKDVDKDSLLIKQLNHRDLYFEPFYDSLDLQKKIRHDLDNHPRFQRRVFPRRESPRKPQKKSRWLSILRRVSIAFVCLLFLVALWFAALYFSIKTSTFVVQERVTPAKERGIIYDERGEILSLPDAKYDLHLDCSLIDRDFWSVKKDGFTAALSAISPNKRKEYYEDLIEKGIHENKKYLHLCSDIESNLLRQLRYASSFSSNRALIIEMTSASRHPFGELANRTIGYVKRGDFGNGLEYSYRDVLSGKDGYQTVLYSKRGRINTWIQRRQIWPSLLGYDDVYVPEVNGKDIHTTLNIRMQAIADSVLRKAVDPDRAIQGACLILMDVHRGAIRGIVNLNRNREGEMREIWNVSIAYLLNPGSLFDPVVLASQLGSKTISEEDAKDILSGRKHLADFPVDAASFMKNLDRFHLSGSNEPFDLVGWAAPHIPEDSPLSVGGGRISYNLLTTPLHLLTFYNTIASHGVYNPPYFVRYVGDYDDEDKNHQGVSVMAGYSDKVADFLKSSGNHHGYHNGRLHLVGQSSMNRIPSGGKMEYQSSFVGFFPEDNPKYSIACMLYTESTRSASNYDDLPKKVVCEFIESLERLKSTK